MILVKNYLTKDTIEKKVIQHELHTLLHSEVHKFFVCKKFEHSPQRMHLLSLTDDLEESSYMFKILLSSDPFLLKAFRDMAKTICQESIGDDCYIGND